MRSPARRRPRAQGRTCPRRARDSGEQTRDCADEHDSRVGQKCGRRHEEHADGPDAAHDEQHPPIGEARGGNAAHKREDKECHHVRDRVEPSCECACCGQGERREAGVDLKTPDGEQIEPDELSGGEGVFVGTCRTMLVSDAHASRAPSLYLRSRSSPASRVASSRSIRRRRNARASSSSCFSS